MKLLHIGVSVGETMAADFTQLYKKIMFLCGEQEEIGFTYLLHQHVTCCKTDTQNDAQRGSRAKRKMSATYLSF